jgi:hypothetical protein
VRFSEPVQPIYKAEVNVRYTPTSGAPVARPPDTLTLSEDRKTLTLAMTASFAPDSTWAVEIARIEDDAHNLTALAPGAWSWRVPAWLRMGAPLSAVEGATHAASPKLASGSEGVWAAWEEDGKVRTRRWSGSAWEDRGSLPVSGSGASPALVAAASGMPWLALTDASGATPALRVFRWEGAAWTEVGTGPTVNSGAHPSLALDASGAPVLVAEGHDGTAISIHAWRYSAAAGWTAMPGSPFSQKAGASNATQPTVAFDVDGVGWVVFAESDATRSDVYLREWTGSTWRDVAGALSTQPGRQPSLVAHAVRGVAVGLLTGGRVQTLQCYSGSCPGSRVLTSQGVFQWVDSYLGVLLAVDDGGGSGHVEVLEDSGAPSWSALPEREGAALDLQPHVLSLYPDQLMAWSRTNGVARDVYVYRYNHD